MRRTEMTLRLSREEKEQLELLARLQKQSLADTIRQAIAQAAKKARLA